MRWLTLVLGLAWIAAPFASANGPTLQALFAEAETTRALDRVLLEPRRFALRTGPALEQLQAIVVCSGKRFEGGYSFRVTFEQLEGETTGFSYTVEAGKLTRLVAAVTPAAKPDPSHEARVDLTQTPPRVTQRDTRGKRDPVELPWTGVERGELFLLFVLAPLSDCGFEASQELAVVQELSLLGPPAGAAPRARTVTVVDSVLQLRDGDTVSATVRLGSGAAHGDIARVEFTDGLYAEPISEGTYDRLHHALPLKFGSSPYHVAVDGLRTLVAAQAVFAGRTKRSGTLTELGEAKLIEGALAKGRVKGWRVELTRSADGARWLARACSAYHPNGPFFAVRETGELVAGPTEIPLDATAPYPADAKPVPLRSRW